MPERNPKIDIVIVNWNAGIQLRECLESIKSYGDGCVSTVTVVDNNSSDGSLNGLENIGQRVKIIENPENLGFGAACNQGVGLGGGCADYILLLNPDAKIVAGAIPVSLKFMEEENNSGVGVCGIQLINDEGVVSRSCARFLTPSRVLASAIGIDRLSVFRNLGMHMSDWAHDSTREVDHVIGAFYLIRRRIFEELNGFDERFFVYLEDLDLSLRVRKAGYKVVYLAEVSAYHAGGGTSKQIKATRLYYSLNSRLQYSIKHFSMDGVIVVFAVTLIVEPITRVFFALLSFRLPDVGNTLAGYAKLLGSLISRTLRHSEKK